MPVDASIPLGVQNNFAMDPTKMMSLADMAMQMRQRSQQEEATNALRQVFSDPSAIDPATGMPTQAALSRVMAIDPQTGMQIKQNMLKAQQQELQTKLAQTELFGQKVAKIKDLESQQASAYQRTIEGGGTPEQAQAAAQRLRSEHLDQERKSGLWSPEELAQASPTYDHGEVTARVENYTSFLDRRAKEKKEERDSAHQKEQEKIARGQLGIAGGHLALAKRAQEETLGGLGLTDKAVDEAAKRYRLEGTFPAGASREERGKITARAGEVSGPAGKPGAPQELEVDAGDGAIKRVLGQQDQSGQWYTADEKRTPIAGVKRILTAGERALDDNALFDQDQAKFMARQYLQGDHSVMQNLGRGVQGSKNIAIVRKAITEEAKAQGMSPEQVAVKSAEFMGLKASERTLGNRVANIEMAVTEASKMADLALEASDKFDRTQFTPLNRAIAMVEKGTGGTEIANFVAANNSFVNVYSRAIAPTGVSTVSAQEHAREMLNTAFTKEQYRSVIGQLQKEMRAAQESPDEVLKSIRKSYTGGKGGGEGGGAPATGAVPRFATDEEAEKGIANLKPGESFVGPDGKTYRKR